MYFCYTYSCLQLLQEWKLVYFPGQTPEDCNLSADCRVTCSIWLNLGNFPLHCSQQLLNQNTSCIEQGLFCDFFSVQWIYLLFSLGPVTALVVVSSALAGFFPPSQSIPLLCLLLLLGAAAALSLLHRHSEQREGMGRSSLRWDANQLLIPSERAGIKPGALTTWDQF